MPPPPHSGTGISASTATADRSVPHSSCWLSRRQTVPPCRPNRSARIASLARRSCVAVSRSSPAASQCVPAPYSDSRSLSPADIDWPPSRPLVSAHQDSTYNIGRAGRHGAGIAHTVPQRSPSPALHPPICSGTYIPCSPVPAVSGCPIAQGPPRCAVSVVGSIRACVYPSPPRAPWSWSSRRAASSPPPRLSHLPPRRIATKWLCSVAASRLPTADCPTSFGNLVCPSAAVAYCRSTSRPSSRFRPAYSMYSRSATRRWPPHAPPVRLVRLALAPRLSGRLSVSPPRPVVRLPSCGSAVAASLAVPPSSSPLSAHPAPPSASALVQTAHFRASVSSPPPGSRAAPRRIVGGRNRYRPCVLIPPLSAAPLGSLDRRPSGIVPAPEPCRRPLNRCSPQHRIFGRVGLCISTVSPCLAAA